MTRALAILLDWPYEAVWQSLRFAGAVNPDEGVQVDDPWFGQWMLDHGFMPAPRLGWHKQYLIITGCQSWAHAVAMVKGTVIDSYDSRPLLNRHGWLIAWRKVS